MDQQLTERQERKIAAAISDLTGNGQYSVNGPFWADVLGMARGELAEAERLASEFRANGNEPVAATWDGKAVIRRETLRRLGAMN